MSFILGEDRECGLDELRERFSRYQEYLRSHEARFPPSAYALATSDWYFSSSDPRIPHDAWLEEVRIVETPLPDDAQGRRTVDLHVRLLNAENGVMEFWYPQVSSYRLDLAHGSWGHRDWRYDEFRLADDGQVIHEIEWAGPGETGRWIIVAADVHLRLDAAAAEEASA